MCKRKYRCFGGDKPKRLFMTFFLLNIAGTVFDLFVATNFESPLYLGISVILQVLSSILMFKTGLTDPGIMPKNFFTR